MNISYNNGVIFERAHLHGWHPNLIKVVRFLPTVMDQLIVTSAWRPAPIYAKDSGIHSQIPLRAIDFRSRIYSNPRSIRDEINAYWVYDPKRPELVVCVYHNVRADKTAYHFHIQVHDNTTVK